MTFKSTIAAVALMATVAPAYAQTYKTDQGHTEVRFGWSHAGVSTQHGEFTTVEGVLDLNADDIEASTLNVTIDAGSVASGFGPLDDHLKSADFLEVETYPEITFVSTGIKRTGDSTADVTGDLTIHGVTKPVVLKATLTHQGEHPLGSIIDYYKGDWVAFSASTEIDHMEFGVGSFSTGPITIAIDTEMKADG
ncbi:YceI family protein [Ruegeria sp.]|uniref:YceI family protein n=1 Tax=Ruegeria sp. TaxID=1879320 RepID=UPI0023267124|nr:YceI family protein [Ruegeria sp.]MDA7967255.1 YceI family protein [Ruegeria sp.]